MVRRVEEEGWTLAAAASAAGVSVRTLSKWLRRFRDVGAEGLIDGSSAPRSIPHRTPEERVQAIACLRRLRFTGAEIAEALAMPLSTVSAILTRIGLGKRSRLEPLEPANRYERKRPGELLHVDVKKLGRICGAGHRVSGSRASQRKVTINGRRTGAAGWEFVHVCIDDATRLAYVEVLEDEKAATAVAFLRRAVAHFRAYGICVERVMADNGSGVPGGHPRPRLQGTRDQAPAHPPLPAAHERQGRALHPHPARRLGVRGDLRLLRGAPRSAHRLARLLQSPPTTRLPRPPTAARAAGGAEEEQPGWVLQLAVVPNEVVQPRGRRLDSVYAIRTINL
jgi:hypothetical protein